MKSVIAVGAVLGLSAVLQGGVMLNPTDDVQRVHRPASNGGPHLRNDERLQVVNFAWTGEVYLKFDLSKVSDLSKVTGMRLELFEVDSGYSVDLENDIIDLYFTNDHSWSEASSFEDVPNHNGILVDRLVQSTEQFGWATWNMDSYDLANNAVDGMLTLVLKNTQQTGSWNMTSYLSNDNPDAALRPRLVMDGDIYLVPTPGAVVLSVLSVVSVVSVRRRR